MKKNNNLIVEEIFKISRLMKEQMSFTSPVAHLSMLQIQTLLFLQKNKEASMSEIAHLLNIELPSATSLINKLCSICITNRKEDKNDRRLVKICLTKKGTLLLDRVIAQRSKKIAKLVSYLPVDDQKDLLRILGKLAQEMEKENEK